MGNKFTFRQRLRYHFDNIMAKGAPAMIALLAAFSFIVILLGAVVLIAFGIGPGDGSALGFFENLWGSFMHAIDPGTVAGDEGWYYRIINLVITLGGIFILSILIGVLSAGIESKLDDLRKGRSLVIKSGHTVILGWSPQVETIISELAIANENQRRPAIVILADEDKVEMEDYIRESVDDTKNTRVICRSGCPYDVKDLAITNLDEARSIIILSSNTENSDFQVIKTVLAITNNPKRKEGEYHITAEIRNRKNSRVAQIVAKDELEIIFPDDISSRIMVQTCLQSGLSSVYTDLMQFDGDEIYFYHEPKLTGKTYRETLTMYETSTLIGIHTAEGQVLINPPMNHQIGGKDEIIAISEDDDTVILASEPKPKTDESLFSSMPEKEPGQEPTLILGWNQKGPLFLKELDNYVGRDSKVHVVARFGDIAERVGHIAESTEKIVVSSQTADIADRETLENLKPEDYKHIILLSNDELSVQDSDARTLISLLHLRDIADDKGLNFNIVSEMLDVRNKELASVTKTDDFIVSNQLISLLMTMVSENKDLMAVFTDILDADGSEIYLKPVEMYVKAGVEVDFYTVVEAAARLNHTAIGYRILADAKEPAHNFGIRLNPHKPEKRTFAPGDRIIVFAED